MKKYISLLLIVVIVFTLAACGKSEGINAETPNTPIDDPITTVPSDGPTEENNFKEGSTGEEIKDVPLTDAIGIIKAEKELFDVSLNVPAKFLNEETTQEDYDAIAAEKGYKSITLNEDGSATYVITKSQHKELLKDIDGSVEESLTQMCAEDAYPNFVSIDHNADFTKFTVTTKSEDVNAQESFSVLVIYILSSMRQSFAGAEIKDCIVEFVNEASGKVIQTKNSADMAE